MIKPVAWMRTAHNGVREVVIFSTAQTDSFEPLYAIPDTHQIMPVKLTDALIKAALPQLMREDDEDKYRALGQLICVWDALVEAAKDEECQS